VFTITVDDAAKSPKNARDYTVFDGKCGRLSVRLMSL
jgi:hypothetical protein